MIFKDFIKKYSNWRNFLVLLYILAVFVSTIQSIVPGPNKIVDGIIDYCDYNNYIIFSNAYHHLVEGKDLYIFYPIEQWDLYKYTPSFAVFFGVFTLMPDYIGLFLWNLLNALVFLIALVSIPKLDKNKTILILAFCMIEFVTSIQNEQSNGIMAGLIILSFSSLERKNYFLATLFVVLSFYIKIFGLVAFALFLFYPGKLKSLFYSLFWFVLLALPPLVYISPEKYILLIKSYLSLLSHDHSTSIGFSVMGWLNSWFGIYFNKNLLVLIGAVIFSIPLIKFSQFKNYNNRLMMLASVLIWVVIFNHKAESPTFIIAMAGVAIWFVNSEISKINLTLLIFAILLTSLSVTDVFPKSLREIVVLPYALKAVPVIFVWFKIIYDLSIGHSKQSS